MALKDRLEARRVREVSGEIHEKTITVRRVAKVVKGGRRFGFSTLVVTGDGKGHVGFGVGKSGEVADAMRKGGEIAKKNMIRVPLRGSTIPHDVVGKFGPSRVILKPAPPGTGVIAGSAVRGVVEAVGIKDIRTKCIGSTNPYNVVQAVLSGLVSLREPESVAGMRGLQIDDLGYAPY